jgi:hypothetical protein
VIVTLEEGADEALVRGELARRGLWTGASLRGRGGTVHLPVAEGSARVAPDEIAALPGVAEIATSDSGHPLVDRHGPTVRTASAGSAAARSSRARAPTRSRARARRRSSGSDARPISTP